ncbi:MAG: hypothetical protein HFF04_08340 [Oscillospiraceae bacterium]|nr:hypothetical protein [Oscillospiraceae bacterium]
MKRSVPILTAALLTFAMTCPALAVGERSAFYPVEVREITEGDSHRLEKVYMLSVTDDPTNIPTGDFDREGWHYTLLDMTRLDNRETETKDYTETVTLNSQSKDMDKIMPQLAATMEVTTEDSYTGILALNTASIKVEATGYKTSSRTVAATRNYPNLSDADTALIPKTIEDNGRTLTLADVQWQEAEGFYHATASYTGTATSKYATGYVVSADYTGEVAKTICDTAIYTAAFSGSPIPIEPVAEQTGLSTGGWKWLYLLHIGVGVGGVTVLAVYGSKKLKSKKEWEEYNKCDGK